MLSLILAFALAFEPPETNSGTGVYPHLDQWGLGGAGAKPLAALGADVLRVSQAPFVSGHGYVLELKPLTAPEHDLAAEGVLTFLVRADRHHWRKGGSMPVRVWTHEWGPFIAQVDARLAQPQSNDPDTSPPGTMSVRVCADGNGQVVERRSAGGERWMAEACVDHDPSRDILKITDALILDRFCEYIPDDKDCQARYRRPFP